MSLQGKWDEEDDELMCLHNPDINPGMQLTKLQARYDYWIKQRANAKDAASRAAADAMIDMIREAMDNSIHEVACES